MTPNNPTPGQNPPQQPPQWLVKLIDRADPMHPRDYWRKRNLADEIQARFERTLGEAEHTHQPGDNRYVVGKAEGSNTRRLSALARWYTDSKEETNGE